MYLNNNGKILRISDCFIPGTNKPYLLVFPISIINKNPDELNKFYISYGEADIRTKLLVMSRIEIEKLLKPALNANISNYKFKILKGKSGKVSNTPNSSKIEIPEIIKMC